MNQDIGKPLLRGVLHQEAFFISLGACCLLIAKSSNDLSLIASVIYSIGLLLLFGISAIYHRIHWQPQPRAFMKRLDHSAIFYVTMGWFALPYVSELKNSLGPTSLSLIISGGIVYTLGAVFYALKKPNLFPGVFGYHELFHFFTIIGAGLHFIVIYQLIV